MLAAYHFREAPLNARCTKVSFASCLNHGFSSSCHERFSSLFKDFIPPLVTKATWTPAVRAKSLAMSGVAGLNQPPWFFEDIPSEWRESSFGYGPK
jgi:hypothetical protein